MADIRQWVNLQKRDRFVEHDVTSRERLGPFYLKAEFRNAIALFFKVRITAVGDEATYSRTEKRGNRRFRLRKGWPGVSLGETSLMLEQSFLLPAAGGNVYRAEAKYRGDTFQSGTIEVVRKLYFQVVKMADMEVDVDVLKAHLIDEFWSEDKKYFIQLKEIDSGGDMEGLSNFDEHQQGNIPALVRDKYNNDRDPFCFVLILVNQLAASELTFVTKENVTIDDASPTVNVRTPSPLWTDLDAAGSDEADWKMGVDFITDDGTVHNLGNATMTANGRRSVDVDTSSLADGTTGSLQLYIKMVNRFRTGLSLGANAICVATRANWEQREDDDMKSTLVHEAGHKVGMVPGGARGGLDEQSTHYSLRGGHCNHGENTCVMYGMIHGDRSNRFCSVCEASVRKLDLDARRLPGFRPL